MGTLTADQVKKLSQPGRYGDGGGGLYLVVSPGLTKSWVLRFMVNRKSTDKDWAASRRSRYRRPDGSRQNAGWRSSGDATPGARKRNAPP